MEHLQFLTKLFDFSENKVQISAGYGAVFSILLTFLTSFTERFLGISLGLFLILFVVMITDFITGIMSAQKEQEKLTSKKGLGWVFKFGSYLVFLAVSFALRKEVLIFEFDWIDVTLKLIHFYILIHIFYWELKSVDENFERLGYSIRILKITDDIFDIVKNIVKRKVDAQ